MEKMKIFVSWSGPRSAAVAEALKEYLPMINNAFDLWLSSDDIAKGSRSTLEIAEALATARAGIICLTPNNLTAPWILFEAGGIAKTVDKTLACTLLIDLQPSDVSKPLGEFQHTRLNERELLKLVKDLNSAAGESARKDDEVSRAFKLCWPELSEKLKNLPSDGSKERPERKPEEMLAELVEASRASSANLEQMQSRVLTQLLSLERMLMRIYTGAFVRYDTPEDRKEASLEREAILKAMRDQVDKTLREASENKETGGGTPPE